MSAKYSLICMGHPLLDISSPVDAALLQKYNIVSGSACLASESHMPLYKEMVDTLQCDYIAGGAALNTSRASQWLSKSANFSTFFGAIGQDDFGVRLREASSQAGVVPHFQVDPSNETGTCACLIFNKERALVANLGASKNLQVSFLKEHWNVFEEAQVIYSEGYLLTDGSASVFEAAKFACETGKVFALNLSAPYVIEFFKNNLETVWPWTEFVFGNEDEAAKFGEVFGLTGCVIEVAIKMSRMEGKTQRPKKIVITRGKESVVVASEGKAELFDVPVIDSSLVLDTNGAGDSFVGGFLYELIRGSNLRKCIAAGNYLAQEVIQLSGCSFPAENKYEY